MVSQLPEDIQRQVRLLLENDDFHAAKQLHDAWLSTQLSSNEHYHARAEESVA